MKSASMLAWMICSLVLASVKADSVQYSAADSANAAKALVNDGFKDQQVIEFLTVEAADDDQEDNVPVLLEKSAASKETMEEVLKDILPPKARSQTQSALSPEALSYNSTELPHSSLLMAKSKKIKVQKASQKIEKVGNKPKNTFDGDAPSIPIGKDGKELPPLTHKTKVIRPLIEGGYAHDPNPVTDFGHKKVPKWSKVKHHSGPVAGQMKSKKARAKVNSKHGGKKHHH